MIQIQIQIQIQILISDCPIQFRINSKKSFALFLQFIVVFTICTLLLVMNVEDTGQTQELLLLNAAVDL